MRASIVIPALLVALAAAVQPLSAQGVMPGSPDTARVMGAISSGVRMLHPARFVLDHRSDLALTPEQVTKLEALASAQDDSNRVRMRRRLEEGTRARRLSSSALMSWSGPIDEEAIRDEAQRMSAIQAESMLAITRDRHAVGALLTPAQLAMLPGIERGNMFTGTSAGTAGPLPQGEGHPYFEFQVERQATALPGTGPVYPPELKAANVEGQVLAQFVVDTAGRVEPGSFKVLKSSHPLFTQAVRDALPEMRFKPAEVGGRKVRQLVQQPFSFGQQ